MSDWLRGCPGWPQVPLALIEGRVTHILWPPSRAGRVVARPPPPGRLLVKNAAVLSDWNGFDEY